MSKVNVPIIVTIERPWGWMQTLASGKGWWVKIIHINPGHRLSLQKHEYRSEQWRLLEGELITEKTAGNTTERKVITKPDEYIPAIFPNNIHRASSVTGCTFLEHAYGDPTEEDIIRLEDDYART